MRLPVALLATTLLIISVLLGCTPQPAATSVPTPPPAPKTVVTPSTTATPPAPATAAWEETWNKWLADAKKEGMVRLYCIEPSTVRDMVTQNFEKKYGIDVEFVTGAGTELARKLQAERQAGLYLGDVFWGGATTQINVLKPTGVLDPLKPVLLLPEVADTKYFLGNKYLWADKERQYILGFRPNVTTQICINTDLVKPGEVKTCRDVLDPKWKGRIVMGDPTAAGTTERFVSTTYENPKLGIEFLRALARQEPVIVKDERLGAEWVARGRMALGLGVREAAVSEMKAAGAPIKNNPPSDNPIMSAGAGNISLINKAQHPNAARVFINWLLGKEAQTLYSQTLLLPSARVDVPIPEGFDLDCVPRTDLEYTYTDDEEFLVGAAVREKVMKEIFGLLLK